MSITNKEEVKKSIVQNDPSINALGPFEVDRQRSFDILD